MLIDDDDKKVNVAEEAGDDCEETVLHKTGRATYLMPRDVYILCSASLAGTKEGQGPLGKFFDVVGEEDTFGCESWEDAEIFLQREALSMALAKAHLGAENIDLLYAGDLLGQTMASSFGVADFGIPLFGVYGACSTCGEMLALASMAIAGGFAKRAACVTSSHFASAEKEFRYPLDYGNQRPLSATWTVTGGAAFVLGNEEARRNYKENTESVTDASNRQVKARITAVTVGKIMDYGVKDSLNMGACMAPAAASTIRQHLLDTGRTPEYYDKIITGDLGKVGKRILIDLLREEGFDISMNHTDCGIEIFNCEEQDVHAGGSGCGCSAVTLSTLILNRLADGEWKRVLFVPTGALLSKTSYNEGKTVPGIAHGVVLEKI